MERNIVVVRDTPKEQKREFRSFQKEDKAFQSLTAEQSSVGNAHQLQACIKTRELRLFTVDMGQERRSDLGKVSRKKT